MTNLEADLRTLAPFVDVPPERDLAPAVRARLAAERRPRPRLVIAVALAVVAIAVALGVPPARSAILRWLGFGTARVEFVDRLPSLKIRRPLDIGPRTSLEEAQNKVSYHILTSKLLGKPREVHLLGDQVGFVYGERRLIVVQSRGTFFSKEIGPRTHVEQLTLNGQPALWIFGAKHFFGYIGNNGQPRPVDLHLAGDVLIWQSIDVTLRLEGKLSRAQALRIAQSFR